MHIFYLTEKKKAGQLVSNHNKFVDHTPPESQPVTITLARLALQAFPLPTKQKISGVDSAFRQLTT